MPRFDGYDRSTLPASWNTRVDLRPDGCWEWTGCIDRGYGKAWLCGRLDYTHRHVFRLLVEEPGERVVHHRCGNRACLNPSHLEALTQVGHRAEHLAEGGLTGMAAINAAKVACRCGLPFDVVASDGRRCSECRRRTQREWQRRVLQDPDYREKRNRRRREARRAAV